MQKTFPIAVFDISSSSVAGAHVLIPKAKNQEIKPSILASSRVFSAPQDDLNIEKYISDTLKQLEKTIAVLKKADNHKPEKIQVLLASPWFTSQTRTITYNKNTPFVCNQKLVDSLIGKEISFILENDMEKFGSMGKDAIIIEKQISQIKLNGYSTNKPFGKKTKNLELFLVITISPKFIIEKIKTQISKEYASAKVSFTTSHYASFVVYRDFLDAPKELMLLDIGEEVTDIALIKDDIFLYQQSFPIGVYEFFRQITKTNPSTLIESLFLVESFKLGKLSPIMTSNVQKALEEFGSTWQRSFQETIDSSKENLKIPEALYFVCDSKFNSFFEELLKRDLFLQHASGTATLNPMAIKQELFSKKISSIDPEKIDETISIATLFSSRIV